MTEPKDDERLQDLKARIARKRDAERDDRPGTPDHHSQAHMAWRMVIELVAGLVVGFGIGYGLDALLGTRPFLLILFTLLGFAAGVRTMLRTAKELAGDEVEAAARAVREKEDGRRG